MNHHIVERVVDAVRGGTTRHALPLSESIAQRHLRLQLSGCVAAVVGG
jgi:hypothetical protein